MLYAASFQLSVLISKLEHLSQVAAQSSCKSGILPAKKDSKLSLHHTIKVPMESSSSMISLTANPSKILRTGLPKLINTATRMSLSSSSEINQISKLAGKSRLKKERPLLTPLASNFWKPQPKMQSTLKKHSQLFPTKSNLKSKANLEVVPEQQQAALLETLEEQPLLPNNPPKKTNLVAADHKQTYK